jgi:hypothetical protein
MKLDKDLTREVTKNLLKDAINSNLESRTFTLQRGYVEGKVTREQLFDEVDFLAELKKELDELIDRKAEERIHIPLSVTEIR